MNTQTVSYKTTATKGTFSLATWFDTYYILCMVPIAAVVLYYNFYAQSMSGLLTSYQAFADVIRTGFDTSATTYYPLTFPMWGYGFLMALTNSNHVALICIQLSLALFSVWYFIETVVTYKLFAPAYIRLFKFLITISIPWYAFHTVRWPYSIASSLLIISIPLLYKATQESKWIMYAALSGTTFGLLLNFRSDYILMPFGLAAITWYFQLTFTTSKKMALWLLCTYVCLIPWTLFTHKLCGHYLLTSTNGGHHALSGLGQKQNNLWKISSTNGDNCPVIHGFIEEQYGKKAATWDYRGDQFLKKKFFTLIRQNPTEYIQKCLYTTHRLLYDGIYNGEFFLDKKGNRKQNFDLGTTALIKKLPKDATIFGDFIGIKLQNISYWIASYWVLGSFILFPLVLLATCIENNLFIMFISVSIVYQAALNICMHHFSAYTTNIFIFLLFVSLYLLSFCLRYKHA